jgi:hypothetical protein
MSMPELVGAALGFLLTIAVFSYLLGDNQFFRLAIHLFVGAAAGYVGALLIYNVLVPQVFYPLLFGSWSERLLRVVPLVLGGLLFFKLSPRFSWLGTVSAAVLVGIGAAVAIGGAVLGTLFSQLGVSATSFNLGNGLIVLLGTLATLVYFQFGVRQASDDSSILRQVQLGFGVLGQIFIAIAFGALFAGVYSAALTAFIERVTALVSFLRVFIPF